MIKIRTRKSKIISIFFGILILVIINGNNFRYNLLPSENSYSDNEIDLKRAGYWELNSIHINNNWSETANTYDWCSGIGAWNDPYIIENISVDYGFFIKNSVDHFIIQYCLIDTGISQYNVSHGIIIQNDFHSNTYGIKLSYNCNNNTISNNTCYDNNWGISLENKCNNNTILNNTCYDNWIQIYIYNESNNNIISNNFIYEISGMPLSGTGIEINTNCSNNIILNNIVNGNVNYGIDQGNCDNNIISNNKIENNGYGLYLHSYSDNNTITGNIANSNNYGRGLYINYYCENNIITNNTANNNNGDGIRLAQYCKNNIINNNTVNNNENGIYLSLGCDNNTISNTKVSSNDNGIYLKQGCNNNTISNTLVSSNDNGVYLIDDCDNNLIKENIVIDNTNRGVLVNDFICRNNTFYKNSFITNSIHSQDDGNLNQWDNGTIGNYWDDYNGKDVDEDGIGDTPYSIDGTASAVDNYPIWWDAPIINITVPHEDNIFEAPPNFEISIVEGIANTTWYTLDNGITNIRFSGLSGIINQGEWYIKPNGQISIIFYANDSRGYVDSSDVTVIKNVDTPQITIIAPITDKLIEHNAPDFELIINDQSPIVSTWYTIDNGLTNFTFIGLTGTINQTAWDNQEDGNITIQFYAEDSIGNIGTQQVIVRKDTENPTWIEPPTDQIAEFGDTFSYDLNATDTSGISYWWVNDTMNFSIDNTTGVITNITMLDIGPYWLEVRAYDPLGHNCSATFKVIVQDTTAPTININSPTPNELFETIAPNFNVEIYDANFDSMWYAFDNGLTNTTFTTNGTINQALWSAIPDGNVIIRFYANDTAGNIGFGEVTIRKDANAPVININNPQNSDVIGATAPNFEISIDELNLDKTWYSLSGGNNLTFTGLTGTINQALWDALPEGNVVITFYANDTLGRMGFQEVTVVKTISQPSPPGIPGYNILLLLGIASTVAVIIVKKRLNHLN